MKKPVWHNLVMIAVLLVAVFALNALSPSLPLASRAIVVGIALDKEGDMIQLSAQIIQSGSSGESSKPGNSTYAILKGEGESLSTAIYDISSSSGYYVSLAHCSAVILGDSMRGEDCFMPLSYLVKNTKLADDTVVVFAEGKGSELIKSEVGLSFLSAFGLKKLESSNSDYSRAVICTVRDFMVDDKTLTGTKVVPLCRLGEPIEEPEGAEQATGKKTEFKLDEAVVLGKAGQLVLNEWYSQCYNLVQKNFKLGNVTLKDGEDVTDLVYSAKSASVNLEGADDGYVVKVNVEMTFIAFSEGRQVGADRDIDEAAVKTLEQRYATGITELFELTRQKGLDIFGACGRLNAMTGIEPQPDEFLRSLQITTEVKINII